MNKKFTEFPKGARFTTGHDKFPAVPVDFTIERGSRAQKRFLLRTLRRRKGAKK